MSTERLNSVMVSHVNCGSCCRSTAVGVVSATTIWVCDDTDISSQPESMVIVDSICTVWDVMMSTARETSSSGASSASAASSTVTSESQTVHADYVQLH